MERLEYPISPKYVPSWGVKEALREIIANALDTGTRVKAEWKDERAVIEDRAQGIPRSCWVLGEGEGGVIGQFHEGLKLAVLVLVREGRSVKVETIGYTVRPSLAYSTTYEAKVLVLEFESTERTSGTVVEVEVSEEELDGAKKLFRRFSPPTVLHHGLDILDAPGSLYITGVYVQKIDALWGYDFTDRTMANRDRTVLDLGKVQNGVREILRCLNKLELMQQLLAAAVDTNKLGSIELNVSVYPNEKNRVLWRRAFREVFGDRACLPSGNAEFDRYITEHGWKIIKLPWSVNYLLGSAGVITAADVAKKLMRTKFVRLTTPLTEVEKRVLEVAKRISKAVVPDSDVEQTYVVEGFPEGETATGSTEGMYRKRIQYIHRKVLKPVDDTEEEENRVKARATGILIHERLHGKGFRDSNQEFEYEMTMMLGRMALELDGGGTGNG